MKTKIITDTVIIEKLLSKVDTNSLLVSSMYSNKEIPVFSDYDITKKAQFITILKNTNDCFAHIKKMNDIFKNDFCKKLFSYSDSHFKSSKEIRKNKCISYFIKDYTKVLALFYLVYRTDICNPLNTSYAFYWEEVELKNVM